MNQTVPQVPLNTEAQDDATDFDKYIDDQAELGAGEVEGTDTESGEIGAQAPAQEAASTAPQGTQQEAPNVNGQQAPQLAEGIQRHGSGGFTNKSGDITDHEGNLIAKNGFARRIYETSQRATARIRQQDELIANLEYKNREREIITDTARQNGLSVSDTAQALELAGRVKRGDVLSVAKEITALLASQGHNVSEILGDDVGNSIDMKAVTTLLDQRLGPVQDQRMQEDQRTNQELNGAREYNAFISNNAFADVQEAEIMAVMKSQRCNPQQAYNQVRSFAQQNKLNMRQPLGPQIEAIGRQRQQRPVPNSGANTRNSGVQQSSQQGFSDPDASWGEIVAEAQQLNN